MLKTNDVGSQAAGLLKRLEEIERLGRLVEEMKIKVDDQEVVVGKRKADMLEEKEVLSALNRELGDLQDELASIAVGRSSGRLPFHEHEADAKTTKSASPKDDAWKSVSLRVLLSGAKPSLMDRLDSAGITTFGELEAWRASGKKIAGLGEAAIQFIDDARVRYFENNPQATEQHTASGDKPGAASRGAAVQRAKLELACQIDDQLEGAGVEP